VVAALLADHRRHNNIEAENEVEDDEEGEFNRKFKRASADLADSGGTTPLLLAAEVWLDRNLEGKRNHAKFVWSVRLEKSNLAVLPSAATLTEMVAFLFLT